MTPAIDTYGKALCHIPFNYSQAAEIRFDFAKGSIDKKSFCLEMTFTIALFAALVFVSIAGGLCIFKHGTLPLATFPIILGPLIPLAWIIYRIESPRRAVARMEADAKNNYSKLRGICEKYKASLGQEPDAVTSRQRIDAFLETLGAPEKKAE